MKTNALARLQATEVLASVPYPSPASAQKLVPYFKKLGVASTYDKGTKVAWVDTKDIEKLESALTSNGIRPGTM